MANGPTGASITYRRKWIGIISVLYFDVTVLASADASLQLPNIYSLIIATKRKNTSLSDRQKNHKSMSTGFAASSRSIS